ncbi:MAG: malonate transporter [Gammaproteobacteria bacterium]
MITTINAIAPVFLIILIGYMLFRSGIIGESIWSAIEHICFYLLLPFLIIRTLSRADLGNVPVFEFMSAVILAIAAMSGGMIIIYSLMRYKFPGSGPSFTSLFQGTLRYHGFVALAAIGPLYGDEGVALVALSLAIMVPLLNVLSIVVLTIYGSSDTAFSHQRMLQQIIRNPLIWACVVGLLLNWTGVPDILFSSIDIIGSGGLGLALLTVGAGIRLQQAADNKLLIVFGVLLRLIGMPMLLILTCWLLGLEGLPRTVAIISGAVPTAATSYVMARKMGGDAPLMSSIVTFQIIAAFFTLPMFIFIAESW